MDGTLLSLLLLLLLSVFVVDLDGRKKEEEIMDDGKGVLFRSNAVWAVDKICSAEYEMSTCCITKRRSSRILLLAGCTRKLRNAHLLLRRLLLQLLLLQLL